MPRDSDKHNDSRGRRDRSPGKGRSGAARGPEKKFAKRGFGGKGEGENRSLGGRGEGPKRSFGGKSEGPKRSFGGKGEGRPFRRDDEKAPRREYGDRPKFNREDRPRGERPFTSRGDSGPRDRKRDTGDRKRSTGDRKRDTGDRKRDTGDRQRETGDRNRDTGDRNRDTGERKRYDRGDRGGARPAGRFAEKKFGDKRPYAPRNDNFRKDLDRPRSDRPSGDRPPRDGEKRFSRDGEKKFSRDGEKTFSRDRGPRKDFTGGSERGEQKPWQRRDDRAGRDQRPSREGARTFDKPRHDRPRDDRGGEERPRFSRSREDRPAGDRPFRERPKFDRPRERQRPEGQAAWQEHPRSEHRSPDQFSERPRRDNEDDNKVFAKRPAFGGRGAYRERPREFDKRASRPEPKPEPKPKKSGERIAKVVSRAGLASRRDAEEWIVQGRVTVNGRLINSPALDVTANDVIAVDGKPLPPRERTRLFMYHKPRGLMTTHADPEGRPTVFDNLPPGLPRLISIGRLDFNTEGLLLLTNDGGLARVLELPDTGWLRRYRVRAHGEVTQAQLDELKNGIEVDGVKYGSIDASLERDQGANVWLVFAIREGKNREVRNVMAHLGLEVNRLIRVSYGPFQLGELAEGQVEEVKTRVLREQLGEKVAALAGADFTRAMPGEARDEDSGAARVKKPFKPAGKSGLIADRKGRRVLVQRTGSEEARARNEDEANGYGPPRRPQRGYHGKRDLKPRDE
jgi:23S rRNA pseudouridine2605 synthase